jgi:hypothetical protein
MRSASGIYAPQSRNTSGVQACLCISVPCAETGCTPPLRSARMKPVKRTLSTILIGRALPVVRHTLCSIMPVAAGRSCRCLIVVPSFPPFGRFSSWGPLSGALVASFYNWQNWWLPFQHLAIGIGTLIAVSAMVLFSGASWKFSPKSVAWCGWIAGGWQCERDRAGRTTAVEKVKGDLRSRGRV